MKREIKNALSDVNKVRKALGLVRIEKLKKGRPADSLASPIRNSIGRRVKRVTYGGIIFESDLDAFKVARVLKEVACCDSVPLTSNLDKFVKSFDDDRYPELEA